MSEVTKILQEINQGQSESATKLLALVYDELRRLAAQRLAQEAPGQTLQATALVHEAYLRLVGDGPAVAWDSRGHFFAAAAESMRRILIDLARKKNAVRHGGKLQRLELHDIQSASKSPEQFLALDDALERFAQLEPAKAQLVKLRFYGGLSAPEAAKVLGVSVATCERWWKYARTWLYCELQDSENLRKNSVMDEGIGRDSSH